MERHCQKAPESLEHRGGMGHALTGNDGKVSVRPATPHRETAEKGEKGAQNESP